MDRNPLEDALGQPPEGEDQHAEAVEAQAAPEPQAEAEATEATEPAKAPERGPDGKFVAKAASEPPAAPAAPEPAHEPQNVPLGTFLDMRDKLKAAEQARKALEDRINAAQQAPEPASETEQFQAALYAQNLRTSRRFAERQYGPELTAQVHDWAEARCDADPHFNAAMRASDDPYEAAMQAYNREQILQVVSPQDLEAFQAWKAASAQAQAQTPTAPQPAAPPRSLVHVPGSGLAGKPTTVPEEGAAFSAAFGS